MDESRRTSGVHMNAGTNNSIAAMIMELLAVGGAIATGNTVDAYETSRDEVEIHDQRAKETSTNPKILRLVSFLEKALQEQLKAMPGIPKLGGPNR